MINSISNTTQIYATSKVAKTTAISAYSDISSAKPLSRMEQMQEKYKDVYSPAPATYSKERANLQTELIKEKYPAYLSIDEAIAKYAVKIDFDNPSTDETKALIEKKDKQFIQDHGGEENLKKEIDFIFNTRDKYPVGWATSNSKELANFYNASVYEGLEQGQSLKMASRDANSAISSYMDLSELGEYNMPMFKSSVENLIERGVIEQSKEPSQETIEKTNFLNQQHGIGEGDTVDLRKYGFNLEWNHIELKQSDSEMAARLGNRIAMYEFMLDNPNIVESEFQKLDWASNNGRVSSNAILKPINDHALANAKLASDVFSKYKIYDSIDIKA